MLSMTEPVTGMHFTPVFDPTTFHYSPAYTTDTTDVEIDSAIEQPAQAPFIPSIEPQRPRPRLVFVTNPQAGAGQAHAMAAETAALAGQCGYEVKTIPTRDDDMNLTRTENDAARLDHLREQLLQVESSAAKPVVIAGFGGDGLQAMGAHRSTHTRGCGSD